MFTNIQQKNIDLINAYKSHEILLRTRRLQTGLWISIILFPIFGLLDFIIYPKIAYQLTSARLTTDFILITILIILLKNKPRKLVIIKSIGLLWSVILLVSINILIIIAEGDIYSNYVSPYYAGLNLVIVALSVLLPWSLYETLFVCCFMVFLYLISITYYVIISNIDYNFTLLFNNLFFLIGTSVICVTGSFFNSKARFKEFCLNYELQEKMKNWLK